MNYKTIQKTFDITTVEGLNKAENYQAKGWNVKSSTPFTVTLTKNKELTDSMLARDIKRYKATLIELAHDHGLYENFGQREVRILRDKYIDLSDYYSEMNHMRARLDAFSDWCASYTPL